jgi:seryl-tRNA synthetase
MLDLKFVLSNIDAVKSNLEKRNSGEEIFAELEKISPLAQKRKKNIEMAQELKERRNTVSDEIAKIKKAKGDASSIIAEMKEVSSTVKGLDEELRGVEAEIEQILLGIPNMLHEDTPIGKDETGNLEVRTFGEKTKLDFKPKDHADLGEELGLLDFEAAALISGARFSVYKGSLARLERALINFMLDVHVENGYEETLPPFLVNSDSMKGTGQLPKFADDSFKLEGTDFWLIPTAEVPVTNFYKGKIMAGETLPKAYAAYTACFRKEAGSYGKDMKGLIRLHQFNKVELVKFSKPEESMNDFNALVKDAESILEKLGLPYRTCRLCSGDISANALICYDMEVWLPSQNRYREISSCSLFGDYQARRAGIRFRPEKKAKPQFVHTINGSGLAIGRTVVAIMENYQNADGSITVPEVLIPYFFLRSFKRTI